MINWSIGVNSPQYIFAVVSKLQNNPALLQKYMLALVYLRNTELHHLSSILLQHRFESHSVGRHPLGTFQHLLNFKETLKCGK